MGPYCARLLADFGAEVIKVEPPEKGDIARHTGPFPNNIPDPEKSGLFLYLNFNKKGITLNLESEKGAGFLKQLVKDTDILIENFEPDTMSKLGLGYEVLEKINPSLIITSISYFGQSGPYKNFKGSEIVTEALGGLMQMTGLSDREPLKAWGSMAEYLAGVSSAVATMVALHSREDTGFGQHIDVSAVETLASILEGTVLGYGYNKVDRKRTGSRHPAVFPSNIFSCKDGYVHVHAPANLDALSRFLEIPEPAEIEEKSQNIEKIESLISSHLKNQSAQEVFHLAQEWRFPFALVLGIDELLDDSQYKARGFFTEIEHPLAGTFTYPGEPFKMKKGGWQVKRPAPLLGEHNKEIYCEMLGLKFEDLTKLKEKGVI
jgi:crotonobetainyl-CoA:carnitine CoA-transferase CaiB-like acyl-CoA transferase